MRRVNEMCDDLLGMYNFVMTEHGLVVVVNKQPYNALKCKELFHTCSDVFGKISKKQYGELIQSIACKLKSQLNGD